MAKTLRKAGQVNMKGKKEALMSCRCCVCRDLRAEIIQKEVRREIKLAMAGLSERVSRLEGVDDWV